MAIQEILCVHRRLYGDGESTKVALDFSADINGCCCAAEQATGVQNCTAGDNVVKEAKVAGCVLSVEFESPPQTGAFDLRAELLLGAAEKAKPVPVHHAPAHHAPAHHDKK